MQCISLHGWELIARIGGGEPSLDDDDDDYVTTRSFLPYSLYKKTLLHNRQNDVDVNNTRNTRQQQLYYLLS
jgi:hypothetical protein